MGWGAAIGMLGAGLFGMQGQASANKTNIQLAREQMAFQERMSSTAMQRAALDAEKAGLNRILALGKPASTPAGQTATVENEKAAAMNASLAAAQIYATRQAGRASAAEVDRKKAVTEIMGPAVEVMSEIKDTLQKTRSGAKESGYPDNLYGALRGGLSSLFEKLDVGGHRASARGSALEKDAEQRWLREEPQRVEARIRQLERNLEWGDENQIWRDRNAKERERLVKEIRELKFKLKLMRGPK